MRALATVWFALSLSVGIACSPNQSPEEIRRQTAEEAARLKQDTTAVAEGVKEGFGRANPAPLDLNRASKHDLASLPGMDAATAERVIEKRPYHSVHELVTRHVVSEDEYLRIQDQILARP